MTMMILIESNIIIIQCKGTSVKAAMKCGEPKTGLPRGGTEPL
jgi:hypothetical protein